VPKTQAIPIGNLTLQKRAIRSAAELGNIARDQRVALGFKQEDLAGLGKTGTRFVGDLERGKPTVQLQMVLDLLDLIGLEVSIQPKSGGSQ
jgi:HTH-type transcriptional regulator/antitoxin HipB